MTRLPEAVPVGAPSPDAVPPPWSKDDLGDLQNPAAFPSPERPSGPRGRERLRGESAGTHLPGQRRARVPGGQSAGMVRAPPVRRAVELERPARPRRR